MNLYLVHRDRRGAMSRIEPEFEKLRGTGVELVHPERRRARSGGARRDALRLARTMGPDGRVRMLLHSIAFGNLKLIAPEAPRQHARPHARVRLAQELGIDETKLAAAADKLFAEGEDGLDGLATPVAYPPRYLDAEDFARTIHCMGTSLLDWVQDLHGKALFAADARVFGLTSEGNDLAWKGYAAVSAAKVALEALSRSIAMEFAPYGVRCNVLQPGVTRHAGAGGDPRQRAPQRLGAPAEPLRPPHHAARRRQRRLPALARRGGVDQRRADPRRRRRARVGVHGVTLHLHGLGHFHPENEITNRFLEELDIGTTDAWILERVGIRSRRTVLPLDYIRTRATATCARRRRPRSTTRAELGSARRERALARARHRCVATSAS